MAKRKIGITGEQLINRLETKKPLSDEITTGLDKIQFIDTLKKHNTLSDIVRDFKTMGMTDFSWGWSSRMAIQAITDLTEKQEMLKKMQSDPLMKKLAEAIGAGGSIEKQKIDRDKARLSYIE